MPVPKKHVVSNEKETQGLIFDYVEEFGETPNIPNSAKGRDIYLKVRQTEPDFWKTASGINGRLSELIRSRQFRNALAGFEVPDDESEDELGNAVNTKLRPAQAEALEKADQTIAKLKMCLTGLGDFYGNGSLKGMRLFYQFSNLLKQTVREGETVYSLLRDSAMRLPKDLPGNSGSNAEQEEPDRNAGMSGLDLLIHEDPKPDPSKSMLPELYTDLYYLDETLGLGLDMPRLDPGSVVKEPSLSLVSSWQEYYEAQLQRIPHSPAARKDRLANVLVGAFQVGRQSAADILPADPPRPYSQKLAKEYAKQLKETPMFRKLCKDPQRVKELLTPDPKRPNKQFNAMLYMFRPFGNVKPEKGREVLQTLKNMLPLMDPPEGRSKEWRALYESIRSIDPLKLPEDPEKKLQEIYDKTNAYMKGKKSLRRNEELQNRFDQCLDVLSVLAGSGPYAKLAAEAVVDRVNEVRIGHDVSYKAIRLAQFGKEPIKRHKNHAVIAKGLDVLPKDLKLLPLFQKMDQNNPERYRSFTPLREYTEYLPPLYSDEEVLPVTLQNAIATAIVLSQKQVYYYNGLSRDTDTDKRLEKYGRAVISGDILNDVYRLSQSPAVVSLANKYSKPGARNELRRQLGLQEPEQAAELIQPEPPKDRIDPEIPGKAPKKLGFMIPEEDQKQPPKKQIDPEIPGKAPKKAPKKVAFTIPEPAPQKGEKKERRKLKVGFSENVEVAKFRKVRKVDLYDPEMDADLEDLPKGQLHPQLAPKKPFEEKLKQRKQQKPVEFDPSKLNAAKLLEDYNEMKRQIEAQKAGNIKG